MKTEADFLFDEWAFLAKTDVGAFEKRRREVIDKTLSMLGPRRNLGELLQREIDATRTRAESPQAALVAIAKMLSDELVFLGEGLYLLRDELGALRSGSKSNQHKNDPINCKSKERKHD